WARTTGSDQHVWAELAVEAMPVGEIHEDGVAVFPIEFGEVTDHLHQVRVDARGSRHQGRQVDGNFHGSRMELRKSFRTVAWADAVADQFSGGVTAGQQYH